MVHLVWFQKDLRIHDHKALIEAQKDGVPLIAFYAKSFSHPSAEKSSKSDLRKAFLDMSLQALKESLTPYNIPLIIFEGTAIDAVRHLAKSFQVHGIYGHYFGSPFERYEAVLIKREYSLFLYETETLIHPNDLGFDIAATPRGFTSFRKKVEKHLLIRPLFTTPLKKQDPLDIDDSFEPLKKDLIIKAGEEAGLKRLQYYLDSKKIKTYKLTRNGMLKFDDSTKFSFYLAHGSLSPRMIYHQIKAFEKIHGSNESTYWVIFELLWRDFFKFQERKHKKAFYAQRGLQNKKIAWNHNDEHYQALINGETGFPLVDANIKELLNTGFMSNRGRQNVASFWVKNVGLDWQLGERFFETHLLDYDAASNTGNWQYIAGIGNDSVPFRFFDIVKQGHQYDQETHYLLHHLPVFKDVPKELRYSFGHIPQEQRALYLVDYPEPIIDFYKGLNLMKVRYESI